MAEIFWLSAVYTDTRAQNANVNVMFQCCGGMLMFCFRCGRKYRKKNVDSFVENCNGILLGTILLSNKKTFWCNDFVVNAKQKC